MHRFIPIYASWQGARVTEIPVKHHARQYGKSKYGLERTVKVILDLIVVKFLATFAQKPMYVFGGIGLMSLAVSGISGLWALYLKYFADTSFIQTAAAAALRDDRHHRGDVHPHGAARRADDAHLPRVPGQADLHGRHDPQCRHRERRADLHDARARRPAPGGRIAASGKT
jgi:hypothetical protein